MTIHMMTTRIGTPERSLEKKWSQDGEIGNNDREGALDCDHDDVARNRIYGVRACEDEGASDDFDGGDDGAYRKDAD